MGPLGRDRRVRAHTGKRRIPGQKDEDSEVEEVPSATEAPSRGWSTQVNYTVKLRKYCTISTKLQRIV